MAQDLAPLKMKLALASRNETSLQELAVSVREVGSSPLVLPTDVTDPQQCQVLVDKATEKFGSLDYLILSAGLSMWTRFDQIRHTDIFQRLMEVNYLGAVYCIQASLKHLKRCQGMIVAISSIQGRIGVPQHSGYAASKHALDGFLETLLTELNGEVRILNVMPGWIQGTQLRNRALSGDGNPLGQGHGRSHKQGISVQECSSRIIRSMEGTGGNLYIPRLMGLLPWLRLLLPGVLRSRIQRAVEKQAED